MIYGVTGMWGANKLGIIKYRIKNNILHVPDNLSAF